MPGDGLSCCRKGDWMENGYMRAFLDSTATVLSEVLKTEVREGKIYYKSTPLPESAVPMAARLAELRVGRVYLDMRADMARRLASAWVQQELDFSDERADASLASLADRISECASRETGRKAAKVEILPIPKDGTGENRLHLDAKADIVVPFETKAGWISVNMVFGRGGEEGEGKKTG